MRKTFYALTIVFICSMTGLPASGSAQIYSLDSPDNKIRVQVEGRDTLMISLFYENKQVLQPSPVCMELKGSVQPGIRPRFTRVKSRIINDTIMPFIHVKRSRIADNYRELECLCKGNYSFILRAYNDGIAYRFITHLKDSVVVTEEVMNLRFSTEGEVLLPEIGKRDGADKFHTSFEENYTVRKLGEIGESSLAFMPVLVTPGHNLPKILIVESDLVDYPGMFITGSSSGTYSLQGVFAGYPKTEVIAGDEYRQWIVSKREPYIARTKGSRSFPWRVLVVAAKDTVLPSTDIVYRLASPNQLKDISWVRGGRCTDDWIIRMNLFNVNFRAGLNTESYKYYIDFARQYGFPYVMLDAGWSDNHNLFAVNPGVNMDEVVEYARQNKIGLFLWTEAITLDRQLDSALDQFQHWGIKGINVDFMDRNDQRMVNFYSRIARAMADRRIMVMFHGAYPNAGMERTYPNVITRESVLGSEYNIWSNRVTPKHDVYLAFLRMVAGSFDYEPIVFNNATQESFRIVGNNVMTQGTRIHQLALNVLYDNPLQVFAGNPSMAMMEPGFTRFLAAIPTEWDETVVLDGQCGEYLVTARRAGNHWYLSAITDWNPRVLDVSLGFLRGGKISITEFADGINADRFAADYSTRQRIMSSTDTLKLKLAPGGGYVARIITK